MEKFIKERTVTTIAFKAFDGKEFTDERACATYERTALGIVSKSLKRLSDTFDVSYLLGAGGEGCEVEVFDIQTHEDLKNLKIYLELNVMDFNGYTDASEITPRIDKQLDKLTAGHEIIVLWRTYDDRSFYTEGDGSLDALLESIRTNYFKNFIYPKQQADKLAKQVADEEAAHLKEAEEIFNAFDKVPEALWEDEYDKYHLVLEKYKDIDQYK